MAFAEATDKAQQWQKFTAYEEDLTTLFPQSSAILAALAHAFLKTGQPDKAVEYYQQARAFAFDAELMQQIRKGLFEAYTAMGDTDSAERYR
jgi:tetratricopeptide (TPR) repeat protein